VAQLKALVRLEYLQKRALNIIFPGGEYVTNLILPFANVEALNRDDSNSHFYSDGHEFGGT